MMMVMLINRNQTYYLALALPGISAAAVQLFREGASAGRKVSRRIWAAALAAAYLMMSPLVPMQVLDWLADAPPSTTLDLWKILGGPGLGGLLLLVVLVGVHARTVKREQAHAPEGAFGTERGEEAEGGGRRFLTRRAGWLLTAVLGAALWIRLYGLGRIVDSNHDEVNPLMAGFRLTQSHLLPGGPWIENFFAQLFLYYNGVSSPLIQFVNLEILNLLGIPLREFYLFLPYAVAGTLSIVGLYFLGRRWFNTPTALLAAALAAAAPFHGVISRINHPMVGIFVNQVFMFLVLEKLLDTRRKVWAVLFSLMLCVEVLSNNGFPFTMLLLAYYGWMRFHERGEPVGRTLKRVLAFKRETTLIWWGALPLIVILLQLALFAVALRRGELVGLLAWSVGHKHPMNFAEIDLTVFGSAFGYILILAALAAFVRNFRRLFRFEVRGLMVWWIILLGLPFLGIFFVQEVHLIATCGIPVFLLSADWMVRGMSSRKAWLRGGAAAVTALVLIEAFSGALAVNLSLKTPNSAWYTSAEGQGAVGGSHRSRAMKSAGYWIRKFGKPGGRVYVNQNIGLGEFYFGKVWCACGDPRRKRLFAYQNIRPDPPVDHVVLIEKGPVSEALQKLVDRYHLAGSVYDGGSRLARIYSKEPGPVRDLRHAEAVRRFDEEFARLDRYVTSPYAGMTFWLK